MEYTEADIRQAFLQDEVARYALLATAGPQRPQYGELELARGVPDEPAEPVTFEDVDAAVAELSALRGEDYSLTYEQVRSLASGERDLGSLAAGIIELARSDTGTVELAATISAEDRRALAAKGWALKDGSYPIPDKSHLRAAAVLAASGHGDVKAARALIRKRAEDLGVDVESLPGFGSGGGEEEEDEGGKKKEKTGSKRRRPGTRTPESMGIGTEAASGGVQAAARQRWARAGVISLSADERDDELLELATDDGEGGPLDDIIREHPEYFGAGDGGLQRPSEGRERPARASFRPGPVSTATRAHSLDTDPTVHTHPSRGGASHPEVERYIDMLHSNGFGGRERPHGSVVTHRRAG